MAGKTIQSKIIDKRDVEWRNMKFIQHSGFKVHETKEKDKLKKSLIDNGFVLPFNVWEDTEGTLWCLDGYHRQHDMMELENEGVTIPDLLPAVFIDCADKYEAAKMVLIFSSQYASITQKGLNEYAAIYDMTLAEINEFTAIPIAGGLSLLPIPTELEAEPRNKPASLKITFTSPEQLEQATAVIDNLLKTEYPGAFFSVSCGEL